MKDAIDIFSASLDTNGGWFRVFGYGLSVIDRVKWPPPFSVREGFRKEWRIGRWGMQVLQPEPITTQERAPVPPPQRVPTTW